MKTSKIIKLDANRLGAEFTDYMKKYTGQRIYITKYNKIIGELRFYTDEEKKKVKVDIAREILKNYIDK